MTRSALPCATSLFALIACLACAPLMAADLMDNGDLSPLGSTSANASRLAIQLTDAKAAYIQQLGQGNLAELTQNGQALSAQMLQQGSDQEAFTLQHGENLMAVIEQVGQGIDPRETRENPGLFP